MVRERSSIVLHYRGAGKTPNQSLQWTAAAKPAAATELGRSAAEGILVADAPKDIPSPEVHARRLAWFAEYAARLDGQPPGLPLRCPCCGCRTLGERGGWEICPVCFWEDDGQDDHDAAVVRGGPNGSLSLTEARANYLRLGACEESMVGNVRLPRAGELPE